MLKGVNKNVIEISDTGNDFFERAILFVRPQNQSDDVHIRSLAADFLRSLRLRPGFYSRGAFLGAVKLLSAAIAGATAATIVFSLIH